MDKEKKIKRYNSEEVKLILYILSSDLSKYNSDDLISFTETIEGRIEVLFEPSVITSLSEYIKVEPEVLEKVVHLKQLVSNLYAPQWHEKLRIGGEGTGNIQKLAKQIIADLGLKYIEPLEFSENNLSIDW